MATVASLVVQIGADIADLKRNTEKIDGTLGGIEKTAASMGKMLAGAFTVGAITTWAAKTVDAASRVNDLALKLGVSTDAIQGWEHAAKLSGSSLDQVSTSLGFMNKTLAVGNDSTVQALKLAGLGFDDIRSMRPEQAFNTIADAIGKIEDPMVRARVAVALFGRTGQELLPAMIAGFSDAADAAAKMSQESIEALDRAGDAWDKMSNFFGAIFGTILADTVDGIELLGKAIRGLNGFAAEMGEETKQVAGQLNGLIPKLQQGVTSTSALIPAMTSAADAEKLFTESNKGHEAQLKKTWAAQDAYNAALREMANQFTGKKLADEVNKIAAALNLAGGAAKMSAFEKEKLGKQLAEMQSQGAKLTPELQKIATEYQNLQIKGLPVVSVTKSIATALEAVRQVALTLPPLAPVMTLPTKEVTAADVLAWQDGLVANMKAAGVKGAQSFTSSLGDFMQTDLPKAIMGAIQGGGDVLSAAGSSIGSFLMSDKGIGDTITKGAKSLFGDKLGAAIGSALPGLGAMLGPMISGLFGKLFGSAGRDSVEAFAKSMGGFDALRAKLLPLGDVGEKLWVNLTQGVGKNNPEQAKAAIEAITKALQEQDALINGLVPSWQDTLSLAEKYGIEVAGLGEKFAQAKLASMANDIAVDFRKLIAAGADMNAVLAGMQDEVQGVVSEALSMGLEIPDSMKPIIQKLIDMGKLTDENGNKLTDMSKLNFSETLSKSVERIIDALDRLIATLGGGVKKAIDDLPKKVNIDVGWNIVKPNLPGGGGGEEMTTLHSGGWIKAHNGMNKVLPFRLGAGEVPIIAQTGEAVLNRQAAARLGESGVAALNGGGGGSVVDFSTVVAELRGQRADAKRAAATASVAGARAMRDAMLLAR